MQRAAELRTIPGSSALDVSVFRLYLLRALYLLIAVGQGLIQWPGLIHHAPWTLWQGVGHSMLGALAALSLLGVRYPLQMLPLLFYEFAWKFIWMLSIALPLWLTHRVDPDTADNLVAIGIGVVLVPIVVPWRYAFANYVKRPGDRWK